MFWQNLNEKELSDMIAEFDKENTGTITFDGFLGEASLSVARVSMRMLRCSTC